MRSNRANPNDKGPRDRGSNERDLIMRAIEQAESSAGGIAVRGSSDPGSSQGASDAGSVGAAASDPDAPTSVSPTPSARLSNPEAPTSAHDPSGSPFTDGADVPKDAFPGYEILREIHRGGQGVVFQAMQLTTKRKVAIKVMHGGATLGSTGKARFEREVHVLGQLNHPNIVNLHDSGITPDGSFFYVMDYISGKPLDQIIREQRRAQRKAEKESIAGTSRTKSRHDFGPDIRSTLELFATICDAVNAAHLRGVIHRDIKPANVRIDANGEPIVVDFGLAKASVGVESDIDDSGPMTMTGQFIGSLPWASPEQAEGASGGLDVRTDVYSLGVVLYQMLTGGKFPYQVVGTMREVLDNIVSVEPARPSTIRKRIDDEVETIVLKALAKDRDRRYQSAGELGRDIKRYLEGEPIEAKRDSAMYVIGKQIKRHKIPAAFAATVMVMTVLFGIGMTGAWSAANAARADAEENLTVAEEQRERAEDNLRAIRDLANTFLFDFSDAIENLRGATDARELVLKKAIEYLDRIEAQAITDPQYLFELADANDKVGDLHGALYEARTGSTDEAMVYYEEAKRIRDQLASAMPGNERVLRGLADSAERFAGVEHMRGNYEEAVAQWDRSIELAEELGDEPRRLAGLKGVGDLLTRIGRGERDLAVQLDYFDRAAPRYEAALSGWRAYDAPVGEQRGKRRGIAVLLSTWGQTEMYAARAAIEGDRDLDAASDALRSGLERNEQARPLIESLAEEFPQDYQIARDLYLVLYRLGLGAEIGAELAAKLGRPDEERRELLQNALKGYDEAEALTRALALDESNLEAQRDLGLVLNRVGRAHAGLGELDAAAAVFQELSDRRGEVLRADDMVRHRRDLAVADYNRGDINEKLAAIAQSDRERVAYLRLAEQGYRDSLTRFRELGEAGLSVASSVETLEELIAGIQDQLAAASDGS
ncbi:MAG: serine/threonine-protein kinase [Phycisphaerales bacterium]